MLQYSPNLKGKARQLRKNLTDSESALWSRLRNRQILGTRFYRQKPVGNYIVDFYAPKVNMVVEIDGSQHMDAGNLRRDMNRDEYLAGLGLKVLRFNSNEVLKATDAIVEAIYKTVREQMNSEIPPCLPLSKGG
jgi:very-short-patch-repair endonuclease